MPANKLTSAVCGTYAVDVGLIDTDYDGGVFGLHAGTGLAVLIKSSQKTIVTLKPAASAFETFKDSKGRNLLKNLKGKPVETRIEYTDNAPDKKSLIALFSSRISPAAGASEITLKAKARILLSDGQTTRELKDTPLKVGPLPFGDIQIEIVKVGTPELSPVGSVFAVQIKVKGGAADTFASFDFVDADGFPLANGGGVKFDPEGTVTEYGFAQEIQSATARLTLWTNVESVDVAINVKAKLGITAVKL